MVMDVTPAAHLDYDSGTKPRKNNTKPLHSHHKRRRLCLSLVVTSLICHVVFVSLTDLAYGFLSWDEQDSTKIKSGSW